MPRSNIYPQAVIKAAPVNVNGGTQFKSEFPMGPGYYRLDIKLNFALTIGTGSGPVAEGILKFIRQINLATSLGETIVNNVPGRALFKSAIAKIGAVPRYDEIAAATATYRVNIPIFFADPLAQRPEDTVLDTSRYTSITLDILTGPLSDLLGTVGTAALAVTADIIVWRSKGRWPADAGIIGYPYYSVLGTVDASSKTEVDLERATDLRYKRLTLHSSTSGVSGMPFYGTNSDAILNRLSVSDSDDAYCKETIWAHMQDANKEDYGVETVPAGIATVDFCKDGSNLSALYSGDKSQLKLNWDNQGGVGANSIVSVLAEGYRSLKNAA